MEDRRSRWKRGWKRETGKWEERDEVKDIGSGERTKGLLRGQAAAGERPGPVTSERKEGPEGDGSAWVLPPLSPAHPGRWGQGPSSGALPSPPPCLAARSSRTAGKELTRLASSSPLRIGGDGGEQSSPSACYPPFMRLLTRHPFCSAQALSARLTARPWARCQLAFWGAVPTGRIS